MINLYLLCTPLLGGCIDREAADGAHVTIAHVEGHANGLTVHLLPQADRAFLDYLEG